MFYVIKIFAFAILTITTTFYNTFYNNNFTLSKCCIKNIDININKAHTSICLANNVFLIGQTEIISVSSTPSSPMTRYNPLSFISEEPFCQGFFTKKDNFNIARHLFPFLIFFLIVILPINQK